MAPILPVSDRMIEELTETSCRLEYLSLARVSLIREVFVRINKQIN